jgi:hypothetical protein
MNSTVQTTDVLVVGNGPAGIMLSLVLSGWLPYLVGLHPDVQLQSKLSKLGIGGRSLLGCDLKQLSKGITGRSWNPMALLFDSLLQPMADKGKCSYFARTTLTLPHDTQIGADTRAI